jgi:bilirubin oxidase
MDRVFDTEVVALGSRKKIKLFHQTGLGMMSQMLTMAHPVHLHGQQYQVLSRKNVSMNPEQYAMVKDGFIQQAWKDTVLVMPGEEIEIIKPFEDYRGLFLYHCHNLEHEDLGMMRQFYVS